MANHDKTLGQFGLILGGIVALGAIFFIMTGGELGGTQKVEHDSDLPPIAQGDSSR